MARYSIALGRWRKITRYSIFHIIGGMLVALASWLIPFGALIGAILFIVYELDESNHINDQAWLDIVEFMVAFYIIEAVLLIFKLLGWIR